MSQASPTDEELMHAYQSGDAGAFAELYRRHAGRVYSYLGKRGLSKEEGDEVFQAAFLKIHRFRHRFDARYPFVQWLYVLTKTALLDHVRKAGRAVPIDFETDLSQIEAPPALEQEKDLELLAQLGREQRAVVEMRIFDELSYEQIATKLGRTEASVRQTLSRALKRLKLTWRERA